MKKYFNLYSTTFYIKENSEGALYNTLDGNIISLNDKQIKVLDKVLEGLNIDELDSSEINFINNIERSNLGFSANGLIKIENSFFGNSKFFEKILGDKRRIEIAQFELTNKCNLNCVFCDENSNVVYRKTGCKKWNDNSNELLLEEWTDIIEQLILLGCNKIEFLGGEPLLQWDKFCKLVIRAHEKGIINIELYTNGILIDDTKIDFLKKNNIKCIIQVVKLKDNKDLLGIDKDFDYVALVQKFVRLKLNCEILLLVTNDNDMLINDYIQLFNKLCIKFRLDFIYPKPNNKYFSRKYRSLITDYKKHIIRCTPATLGILLVKNPCYYNRIALDIQVRHTLAYYLEKNHTEIIEKTAVFLIS